MKSSMFTARRNRPYWTLIPENDGTPLDAYHLQWPHDPDSGAKTLCRMDNPLPIKTWEGKEIEDHQKCDQCVHIYGVVVNERIVKGESLDGLS